MKDQLPKASYGYSFELLIPVLSQLKILAPLVAARSITSCVSTSASGREPTIMIDFCLKGKKIKTKKQQQQTPRNKLPDGTQTFSLIETPSCGTVNPLSVDNLIYRTTYRNPN